MLHSNFFGQFLVDANICTTIFCFLQSFLNKFLQQVNFFQLFKISIILIMQNLWTQISENKKIVVCSKYMYIHIPLFSVHSSYIYKFSYFQILLYTCCIFSFHLFYFSFEWAFKFFFSFSRKAYYITSYNSQRLWYNIIQCRQKCMFMANWHFFIPASIKMRFVSSVLDVTTLLFVFLISTSFSSESICNWNIEENSVFLLGLILQNENELFELIDSSIL